MQAAADSEQGRYASGLIALSGGRTHGIEEVLRVTIRDGDATARPGDVVGALRSALGSAASLPLPFRIAASGLRAGLGAIEEGLRPAEDLADVTLHLRDGAAIVTRMPVETAILIRRDAEIVRAALDRFGLGKTLAAPPTGPIPEEADAPTSIFRYEKRNGRLRRIASPEGSPKG